MLFINLGFQEQLNKRYSTDMLQIMQPPPPKPQLVRMKTVRKEEVITLEKVSHFPNTVETRI